MRGSDFRNDRSHLHNRHSTATPLHFGVSQGFVCVVFSVVGNVGWSPVRSVDVTPSRSRSKGVETTRLEARAIETESQKKAG